MSYLHRNLKMISCCLQIVLTVKYVPMLLLQFLELSLNHVEFIYLSLASFLDILQFSLQCLTLVKINIPLLGYDSMLSLKLLVVFLIRVDFSFSLLV